jgi:hypothetical protein
LLNYPPVITKVCKYCKANATLERHGSGRPTRKGLDYWYTTDHQCPESDRILQAKEAELLTMKKIVSENLF